MRFRNAYIQQEGPHLESMDASRSSLLRFPSLYQPTYGLSTSRRRCDCRLDHWHPIGLVRIQAILPCRQDTFRRRLHALISYEQPLSHHQAYKPYSPRVPKDDEEIPLHAKIDPRSSAEVTVSTPLQSQSQTGVGYPALPQQVDGNGYRDEFATMGVSAPQEASFAQRYPAASSGMRQDPRLGATSAASGESDSHLLRQEAR